MIRLDPVDAAGLSGTERATEIHNALASLEDIDRRYERDRDGIARWVGPDTAKQRLFGHLDARRARERQPVLAWLAVHRAATAASAHGT